MACLAKSRFKQVRMRRLTEAFYTLYRVNEDNVSAKGAYSYHRVLGAHIDAASN